jgi:ABC-type transport system involved in cytochrome c biogenesis permease subunit
MSTTEVGRYETRPRTREVAIRDEAGLSDVVRQVMSPLASLRLTVVLLGLSLVLVLAGTVAQIEKDVWFVVREYFRTWIAWIDLQVFLPRALDWWGAVVFPFPGGKLLGVLLAANLVAAHAVRFKVAASGRRLWAGWATIGIAALMIYGVVASGSNTTVESELSPAFVNMLWHVCRASLGGSALALAYVLALTRVQAWQSAARWLWWFGAALAVLLLGLTGWLFINPDTRLDASGLRILWQLAKALGASAVLAAGCWAVFSKRAGIVVLHSGIALLMFSELYTSEQAVEAQMRIAEGQTATYAEDMRTAELAFTDFSDPSNDRTTVVPASMLRESLRTGDTVTHRDLPLSVRVIKYLPNARTRLLQPGEKPVVEAGLGQLRGLDELATSTGVEVNQAFDVPAMLVEFREKDGEKASRGVYLLSPFLAGEPLTVDGKSYDVELRFKRIPKQYQLTLIDFKYERYEGTETPKNYESVVRFRVPEHKIDRTVPIYMNNPLRYSGDTLYQADWDRETERGTVLQVVTNSGWMIPYVACVIVAVGMLVHFMQAIIRFVARREDEARRQAGDVESGEAATRRSRGRTPWSSPRKWVPAALVVAFAAVVFSAARPVREKATDMRIHEFGKLPVAYGGRIQPMDTLARNALRTISGKSTYEDKQLKGRQPAIRWLLDVVSLSPAMLDHRVIRVENIDVLQTLGLKPRKGFRYSMSELFAGEEKGQTSELRRQVALAREVPEDDRDLTQQKFIEAYGKANIIFQLRGAFDVPKIGASPQDFLERVPEIEEMIAVLKRDAPRPVPPSTPEGAWLTLYEAYYQQFRTALLTRQMPPEDNVPSQLTAMFDAYRNDEALEFNGLLSSYQKVLAVTAAAEEAHERELAEKGEKAGRKPAERLSLERIAFESWFNDFDPLFLCWILYLAAFVLAVLAWFGWFEGFNRAANWLLWFTFAVHTFGLICRIYISGRPPVTNLYSSAVFIGWAAVLFGLLFEAIYRLGIGNLVAAVIGFPTLVIAHYLSFDNGGDTLAVMQAVLDTNFWLATHVVCITLGYATTFVAGFLGLMTILGGLVGNVFNDDLRRQLNRMTYGTLCFAIFFSLVGTILGGLWADDSWGRFWGWDPKENGALMIVIWNAIVLHARWGKMVGERGLASLTVLGNIMTAWSWFGVNQLEAGLHSYGRTSGLTTWLLIFVASQLAVVAAAYLGAGANRPRPRGPALAT